MSRCLVKNVVKWRFRTCSKKMSSWHSSWIRHAVSLIHTFCCYAQDPMVVLGGGGHFIMSQVPLYPESTCFVVENMIRPLATVTLCWVFPNGNTRVFATRWQAVNDYRHMLWPDRGADPLFFVEIMTPLCSVTLCLFGPYHRIRTGASCFYWTGNIQ